jgi:antibiotic biosynthesis monooxygenase (ABM) superfamily enzyme
MEEKLMNLMTSNELTTIPGYVGSSVYRMDADSNELYLAVAFESKDAYFKNANSPEQDARYREMVALLEREPEWHDGEIIYSD